MIRKRKLAIVVGGVLLLAGVTFGLSVNNRDGLKSDIFGARRQAKDEIYFSGPCSELTGTGKSVCLSSPGFVTQTAEGTDILEYRFSLKADKQIPVKSFTFNLKNTGGRKTATFNNFRLATSITTDSLISKCSLSSSGKEVQKVTCDLKKPFVFKKNMSQGFYLNGDGYILKDGEYSIVINGIDTSDKKSVILTGDKDVVSARYFQNSHLINMKSSVEFSDSEVHQRKYVTGQKDLEIYSFKVKSVNETSKIAVLEVNSFNDHDPTIDNCFTPISGKNVLSNVRLYSGEKMIATGTLSSDAGIYRFSFLDNMITLYSGSETSLKIVADIIPENFRGENYSQANCAFQVNSWAGLMGTASNSTSHDNIVNVYNSTLDITPKCGAATEGIFSEEPVWAWDYICIHPSSSTPVIFDATKIGPNGKGMWTWTCIPADFDWSKTIDCAAQSE